jgi:hypothetical protein
MRYLAVSLLYIACTVAIVCSVGVMVTLGLAFHALASLSG